MIPYCPGGPMSCQSTPDHDHYHHDNRTVQVLWIKAPVLCDYHHDDNAFS
ncbi:unnamed protein product [Staurois parvus]|uniref:Uncharacterized protein n=1 Tax=Staurois parvus TaxID=386267 RepID=A0ABN9F922_9NEOB|nr:unnamed protein product [Staurois parvus]